MRELPEASIIIRTFNEEKYLPQLLKAIDRQTYRDFEVIIVDSGSYDRTPDIARRAGAHLLQIDGRDFTFGYSLNAGIESARGTFVVIVSAHTEPTDEHWLQNLLEPLRQLNVAMCYGRQLGTSGSKFGEIQDFKRTFDERQRILTPPEFFANNANSAIQRVLWTEHQFDESLTGLEDIEWAKFWMERGYVVVYEPKAAIYHIHEESWRQVHHRYHREAVAWRNIGLKRPIDIIPLTVTEAGNLFGDLRQATRSGCLTERVAEIFKFRFYKVLGTTKGLLNGRPMEHPQTRDKLFFDRTCKAVVIHGPNHASLEEIDMPAFRPGDVLIQVAYEGVCSTDLEIFSGTLGYYRSGLAKYPVIPGHEFSGWVARVGPNVKHLSEGDPVVVECIQSCGTCEQCLKSNWIACEQRTEVGVIGRNGGYAEYVAVPGRFVHKMPSDLDMRKAALCEPLAVVLKGLRRLSLFLEKERDRQDCAVIGAGPIGHLCAQLLALRGHSVVAFDRDERRRSYFQNSFIQTASYLDELDQFDVLIEATGDPEALHTILTKSKAGATILLLGLPYSRREFNFEEIVAYDKTIIGSVGSSAEDFEEAVQLLPQLPLDPFIENVVPLSEFADAWQSFRRQEYLKTLLKVIP